MYSNKWRWIHEMEKATLIWFAWIAITIVLKIFGVITILQCAGCVAGYSCLAIISIAIKLVLQYL